MISFAAILKHSKRKGYVYMLHKVGENDGEFNVSVRTFKLLIANLKDKNVINLSNWEKEDDFIALTFDDVSDSFYNNAYPLLEKYKIPYTVFINISLLDKPGYITTKHLKEISLSNNCTVGSHGVSHSYFRDMNKIEAENDLRLSKEKIEDIIGRQVEMYAFPYGSYFACGFKKRKLVKRFYKYGFSTIMGPIPHNSLVPIYFLPRVNITNNSLNH